MDSRNSSVQLKQEYNKYKKSQNFPYIVGIITGILSLYLLFQITIPQVQGWLQLQQEVQAARQRISIMSDNLSKIQSLDTAQLEADYSLTTAALPGEKDYAGVLNAVTTAAVNANIGVEDFFFTVGNIASSSADLTAKQPVRLQLVLNGDSDGANKFIKEIEQKIPLGQVFSLEGTDGSINAVVQFYHEALPSTEVNKERFATTVDVSRDRDLLQKLQTWRDSSTPIDINEIVSGSESAALLTSPPF